MAGNLKKFVNPRFIKTIDLALMKTLLARHEGKYKGFSVDLLDQEEDAAREALEKLLTGAEDSYPEGLRGDLHRIAELGDARGLEIIQAQAARQGVDLFPDMKTGDEDAPNKAHDPKHIAVRVFLEHPDLFDAAADHMAMLTADRLLPADLSGANLRGADLSGADLRRAVMAGCDLARALFHGAQTRQADLAGANLTGVRGLTVDQAA